jgi:glycosyltransferase involved in cell wall biosynthesis
MHLLVVSHSYMGPVPRSKWFALKQADPSANILVITPRRWADQDLWTMESLEYRENRLQFLPVKAWFCGYVSRHFYSPGALLRAILEFRPDIIQVEAEPWSLVYLQLTLLRRLVSKQSALVFFSWWNTPKRVHFPFSVLHRYCLGKTNLAIAGNHGSFETLANHGYRGRVEMIPQLGVDISLFSPIPDDIWLQRRMSRSHFVVGYVGRLTKQKGVDVLLEAVAIVKGYDCRLLIVGGGSERAALESQARSLGISNRVEFIGPAGRSSIPEHMRQMDMLVLPSTREQWEQFGHVLVEAMACGTPVIGSTSGEIPYLLEGIGLLFPISDSVALAKRIELLAGNIEMAIGCRNAGLHAIRDRYSHDAIARRLAAVYSDLISRRSDGSH